MSTTIQRRPLDWQCEAFGLLWRANGPSPKREDLGKGLVALRLENRFRGRADGLLDRRACDVILNMPNGESPATFQTHVAGVIACCDFLWATHQEVTQGTHVTFRFNRYTIPSHHLWHPDLASLLAGHQDGNFDRAHIICDWLQDNGEPEFGRWLWRAIQSQAIHAMNVLWAVNAYRQAVAGVRLGISGAERTLEYLVSETAPARFVKCEVTT